MSAQQADILTSELDSYRMLLNGVIRRIAGIWLLSRGIREEPEITWEEINLQDLSLIHIFTMAFPPVKGRPAMDCRDRPPGCLSLIHI